MKRYILTKEQFNSLMEAKKNEREVIKEIKGKIDKVKKNITESKQENGIISILKPYYKKGKITKTVSESLIKYGVSKEILILTKNKL